MELIAPIRFSVQATANADGTWNMDYEEMFADATLVKNTAEVIRTVFTNHPAKFSTPDEHTMRFEYRNAQLGSISGHMAMEFMQWSSIGQMKMGDLLASAMTMGFQPKEQP